MKFRRKNRFKILTLLSDNPANVKDELLVKKIIKLNNIVIFEMEQNLYDHAQKPICLPEFVSTLKYTKCRKKYLSL